MILTAENILLVGSILLFIALMAGRTGYKYGVPVLLLFLIVGMLAGSDGFGIEFSNPALAQFIGVVSLSLILFSGGMDTSIIEIKPVLKQGIVLATLGVLLTAAITGGFVYLLTQNFFPGVTLSLAEAMLLASVMSSTDSASVFAILRSKGLLLKHNLRPLLELESGSNDPMAYMLTITLIQWITSTGISGGEVLFSFFSQLIIGAMSGYFLGKGCAWLLNRIDVDNDSLYPVLLITCTFFLFSFTDFIGGNGYLAVYLGGLVVGNAKFIHKKSVKRFFDGLAWLSQIIMFLALGLLVNPSELLPIAGVGLIVGVFMIVFSRPFAVWTLLGPFRRMTIKSKWYVSWVGLRGAVPIIFATYPLLAGIENARIIYNIVFFITILSLLIQGTTVPSVARFLHLALPEGAAKKRSQFGFDFSEEIKSAISEVTITAESLRFGNKLMNIPLPDKTLVVMLKRGDFYLIPKGQTIVQENDVMLIITDDQKALEQTYKELGITGYPV